MNACKWLVLPVLTAGLACGAAVANPYFGAVLNDNPALYWTFDEASGKALNYGYLGGGNLGPQATRGTSTTTAGGASLGTAAQFDGGTRFSTSFSGGSVPLGNQMQSYAIEMWVQSAAPTTSNQYLMEVTQAVGNSPAILYNYNPQALEMFGSGRTGTGGPTALADGQWHHVVVGRHASTGEHTFIVDGGAPQTFTGFNQTFRADGYHIHLGGSQYGGQFPGSIDEMAVYDLSALNTADFNVKMADIAAHRTVAADAPAPAAMTAYTWEVLKANPRFYWNFNEPSPQGNAVDLVRGQANDELVAYGGARRKLGASANLGYTAAFDGDNFFAANALADGEMPGAWAVEMWLQADGILAGNRSEYLLNAGNNNPALIYDFGAGGDNKIELFSSGGRTAGNGPTIDDNEWHHIVATFYGNNGFGVADRVDFAVDGVVMPDVGRGGFSSGFDLNSTLRIGAALAGGQDGFRGKIDEVALYDLSGLDVAGVEARTEQIASHYHLLNEPAATALRYLDPEHISYTFTAPTGGGAYADPDFTKLTDGVIGSTGPEPWASGEWVGWNSVDPVLTFEFDAVQPLDSVFIDYLVGNGAGVHAPDDVTIEFSLDGSDYASIDPIVSDAFNNFSPTAGGWNRRAIVDLEGTQAQFVRMTFANDAEWTFLGEVQFVVPEPGTWLLLLSALACALLVRRKR